jgi:endonuclease-3 related protein
MSASSSVKIQRIVRLLARHFGEIGWWPGDPDEVMIGAILTQQTRWENVRRALAMLRHRNLCSIAAIHSADLGDIEEAVRCTGFYRIKAKRLKNLAAHVMETYGSVTRMGDIPTEQLRKDLIAVNGIGFETADSILCYGFSRTSFVIDTYTRRIMQCAGVREDHASLKLLFENALRGENHSYRQTHAHMVEYAKEFCGKKRCDECILMSSNV